MSKGLRALKELEKTFKHAYDNPVKQCCENCEYYLNEGTPICRRKPPREVYYAYIPGKNYENEIKHEWVFARTSPLSWCGEWRRLIPKENHEPTNQ